MKSIRSILSIIVLIALFCSLSIPSFADSNITLSKEDAEKALLIALTNYYAKDARKSDGSYDQTKFHGADYDGQYKMIVTKDGSWTQSGDSSWSVENIIIEPKDFNYTIKLSGTIEFDGRNYIIPTAHFIGATHYEADVTKEAEANKLPVQYVEASSKYPMFTIPYDYITGRGGNNKQPDDIVALDKDFGYSAAYDNWLLMNFNFLNNSCSKFNKEIKKRLNDEKSFKHIETAYTAAVTQSEVERANGILKKAGISGNVKLNDVLIITKFSAKNGFNATIKQIAVGILSYKNDSINILYIGN